jgi:PKHD-type hydroxylase
MQAEVHKLLYVFPSNVSRAEGGQAVLDWAGADPFAGTAGAPGNNALHLIKGHPQVLTADECNRAIAHGEATGKVEGESDNPRAELDEGAYRVSRIAWIQPTPETRWLYHRVGVLLMQWGREFGVEVSGFADPLQYTVYGPGEYFRWHMDLGPGSTSTRKVSLTVQLSGENEYAGGALEFITAPHVMPLRQAGAATVFPSYLAHRVTPVESGVRRSLVAWACGPAFR